MPDRQTATAVGAEEAPLVSVLISTYNRPLFLAAALKSALGQTLTDIEVIVRDDAGTPGARELISAIGDDRVVYRRNTRNMRLCATNNLLYREARGRYVAHLDDDDEWEANYLQELVATLEAYPEVNLAFCNHVVVDEQGNSLPELTAKGRKEWGREGLETGIHKNGRHLVAVRRAVPASHAAVVRRSALDLSLLDARVDRAWDLYISALAVRTNGLVYFDRRPLTAYRVHSQQMSDIVGSLSRSDDLYSGLVLCLDLLAADPQFKEEHSNLERNLARQRANWSLSLVLEGRTVEATHQAARAVHASAKPWPLLAFVVANCARVSPRGCAILIKGGVALGSFAAGLAPAVKWSAGKWRRLVKVAQRDS